jgi:hypothetical protein
MRTRALLTSLCAAALVSAAAGCEDDDDDTDPTPVSPLVGTWDATSLTTPTGNALDNGMSLTTVIGSTGTIALNVTGDQLGLCDPGPDCTVTGTWTNVGNTLTITSGTDVITLTWTMAGEEMTWTGTIEGVATTVVFDKDD